MAKVTLLTSRKISECFKLDAFEKLPYSQSYINVYKVKGDDCEYGIAYHTGKEAIKAIFLQSTTDEDKVNEVAKIVKPFRGKVGDFDAQVYVYCDSDNHYYIAREYPYNEDEDVAKYEYMNAILEMIFNNEKEIDEFYVYSHDKDFDFDMDKNDFDKEGCTGDINMNDIEDITKYFSLQKLFEDFINKARGRIKLFQNDTSYPRIIKTFPETILKSQEK